MENNDLTKALMKRYDVQEFMGGGEATHTMPDGTVMPGATHAEYEAMGYQEGGVPMIRRKETGAVINDAEKNQFITALLRKESGAVINDSERDFVEQTYFPQRGDTEETLAAKQQAIAQAIQTMEQNASPRSAGFAYRMRQGMGMPMEMPEEQMQPMDPAMELESALEGLQIQKSQAKDPDEIKALDRMIEAARVGASAPLGQMAAEIQAQGRGEDTSLAHLRPGEVILPPEAFEDEQFERTVNAKFEELGIDPEMAVSSVGIASLNPMTGLEEFGFFKKLAKGVKKVVKKVVRPISQGGSVYTWSLATDCSIS
jgi:hypothetical protein